MMRLVAVVNGSSRLEETDSSRLASQVEGADWFWLDVEGFGDEDVDRLGRIFDLDPVAMDDVRTVTEFPKADDYERYGFFSSHSPALEGERITTVEMDGFFGPSFLLTFHRRPIPGVEWAFERLEELGSAAALRPDTLLSGILEAAARRSLQLVDGMDARIIELENQAVAGDPSVVAGVQALRRDAIILRRVLAPERDMLRSLAHGGLPGIGERARRRLDSVYDDCFRVVESLDSARALLASVVETYRSTVAERTNEVMKVLTVFSAIILPLSLLAGIYGMNFANIPELGWRWGYFGLLAVMAVVGAGLWLYFARRGFIGGPRLPRVDRVVGRGLAEFFAITTTPVRALFQWVADEQHDRPGPGRADTPGAGPGTSRNSD